MDVLEAIYTRKSIRKFTGEPLSKEELETVLRAGFSAPSAHNFQPWHFVVITDAEKLEHIAKHHPYGKMAPGAGCAIITCGDIEKQNVEGFLVEDCSAAIQNMLLAAHGTGLGAVWCGIYPRQELMQLMKETAQLPDNIIPVGMMVIGHKAQEREATDKYNEVNVHHNQW